MVNNQNHYHPNPLPNRSNRDIYDALSAKGASVRIVGDANSPRFLNVAIREGHLAGIAV